MWNAIKSALAKAGAKRTTPDDHLIKLTEDLLERNAFDTQQGMAAMQAVFMADAQRQRAHERRLQAGEARWKQIRRITLTVMALAGVMSASALYLYRNGFKMPVGKPVSVVSINGEIGMEQGGVAENIIPSLRRAFENPSSKGVILRINSPGGLPVDSERVNRELDSLKKKYPNKEVTAVIETIGASAAYMIAVHADKICAGQYSLVGSIGAVVSAWNVNGLAERLQVKKEAFGSGKFKALLDPFKVMDEDDRRKVFDLVGELGGTFAAEVQSRRKERLKLTREELSTGEVWTGTQAVKNGLIDEICTLESVASRYDAVPRDYGPYTSNVWTPGEVGRALGAGFLGGMMGAAAEAGTLKPR
ncbi:S49 family peptidase [Ottowia sp.]|uniref:S49 family peptidase n=1 Tax=Ottowia sp. TaxID=1898956 RepID=UPI0025FF9CE9|nr:S49 family peptidase [Ottowia sp.]MBK6616157.1 S49 family peptidase [Ottowia sp.]